ncbi:hypothetical protein D210916BOD24_19740 [Alteromonas sp. D210916BOD_24]|uniref:hypothetical protein n=1 Tax=Alteromonas sp. D210916BOD_24 TaxID=3157618 RepID=UPI00399CF82A
MKKSLVAGAVLLVSTSMLSGCVIHVGNANAMEGSDFSSILGNIDIAAGKHAGDISSVNGNVEISEGGSADEVSIVNGNLNMEGHVTVGSVDIVNGDITATTHLTILDNMESVNGNIQIPNHSNIGGSIETVNGDIEIANSVVKNNIETVSGDIALRGVTHVVGDIVFHNTESSWGAFSDDKPTLTIGQDVTIDGNIILERPVTLELENDALHQKVVVSYSSAK